MFKFIKKLLGNNLETLSVPRSSKWNKVRKEHLKKYPTCCACGGDKKVTPHHIVPVHVNPSLELDFDNLITLCEDSSFNCHLFFGHFKNWRLYNPNVVNDSKNWLKKIKK